MSDYPHMPGERRVVNRLVADSARAEAAGAIKSATDYLVSVACFAAGISVAALLFGDTTFTLADLWAWTGVLGVITVGRVWWTRRKLRRFIRTLEVDHPWPDSK